jgi:hypothetical protein
MRGEREKDVMTEVSGRDVMCDEREREREM